MGDSAEARLSSKVTGSSPLPPPVSPQSHWRFGAQPPGSGRGILIASIDPDGPAARAGLLVGDIVTTWNAKPVDRVREVMRLLGSESIGKTIDLGLLRGGAPTTLKVVIGERPVA
jgi:S1-C subfamily serine protease